MRSETTARLQIHILQPPPDFALRHLQSLLHTSIDITTGPDALAPTTHVLVHGRPSADQLASCPNLQALIVPYAGVPADTRSLLISSYPDLPVYNLHHNAAAASELAMALFLAAAKTLVPVDRTFRNHDWRSRYSEVPTLLLEGRTAVIVGFGAIGSRLAAVCHALGMDVHGVRRRAGVSTGSAQIHPPADLHKLLPQADALFVAVPLTPETDRLMGSDEIALLPASCVLVNISRGSVVDEEALYLALKERRIAAAGIDVWYNYPQSSDARACTPPSRFPFHKLDNVVMSPHRGGAFGLEELERRRMDDLAQTLNAIALEKDVPHRVDIAAGY